MTDDTFATQAISPDPAQFKVFVSYSRHDSLFADELVRGLEAIGGFDVMIDRTDIHEGEEWKARLGTLIAEADTVVFVLTPRSASSPVCQWEVKEAEVLSKRILPVLAEPLGSVIAPTELAALNYIRFDPEDNGEPRSFIEGLVALKRTLNTDIDWLREHTRLLVRAREWEDAGRVANRLLSGDDIDLAKAWLMRRPNDAPAPTELHRDYIAASEQAESARVSSEQARVRELQGALQAAREAEQAAEQARIAQGAASRRVVHRTLAGLAVSLVLLAIAGFLGFKFQQAATRADKEAVAAVEARNQEEARRKEAEEAKTQLAEKVDALGRSEEKLRRYIEQAANASLGLARASFLQVLEKKGMNEEDAREQLQKNSTPSSADDRVVSERIGSLARKLLGKHSSLSDVELAEVGRSLESQTPGIIMLPPHAYGVLVSLFSSVDKDRLELSEFEILEAIRVLVHIGAHSAIPELIRATKWFKQSRDNAKLAERRDGEARLFEYALSAPQILAKTKVAFREVLKKRSVSEADARMALTEAARQSSSTDAGIDDRIGKLAHELIRKHQGTSDVDFARTGRELESSTPAVLKLPPHAYGVLVSLFSSIDQNALPPEERDVLHAIRILVHIGAYEAIPAQILVTKWFEQSFGSEETEKRREDEAELFEYALAAKDYPAELARGLWLPDAVHRWRTRSRGSFSNGWPAGAIINFTAGRSERGDPDAVATIRSLRDRFGIHFVISRTGKIYQTLPLDRWGSHAGLSAYPGLGKNVSNKVVGIEIPNAGRVVKTAHGYEPWWNRIYPEGDPRRTIYREAEVRHVEPRDNILVGGHFLKYTPEQERSLVKLLLWLRKQRPDVFSWQYVLGHDEVSPKRKDDPGGALSMTMPEFRAYLEKLEQEPAN